MRDFGSVVTFELDGGYPIVGKFSEALRYFAIAASVGSTESLVMPSQLLGGTEFNSAERTLSLITAGTVRLSIGIEDADDLVDDLRQALEGAFI